MPYIGVGIKSDRAIRLIGSRIGWYIGLSKEIESIFEWTLEIRKKKKKKIKNREKSTIE